MERRWKESSPGPVICAFPSFARSSLMVTLSQKRGCIRESGPILLGGHASDACSSIELGLDSSALWAA